MAQKKAKSAKKSSRTRTGDARGQQRRPLIASSPPKAHIMGLGDDYNLAQQEASDLLLNIDGCRVLYYPACLMDWNPVRLFHSFCDVFLMCDWAHTEAEVREAIKKISIPGYDKVDWSYPVPDRVIRQVTDMNNLPWDYLDRDAGNCKSWGLYVRLKRVSDLGEKAIHLIYFQGNPLTAYQKLFVDQGTAPKFICLKHSPSFPMPQWRDFTSPAGPLSAAIGANPHKSLYVLRDVSAPPVI